MYTWSQKHITTVVGVLGCPHFVRCNSILVSQAYVDTLLNWSTVSAHRQADLSATQTTLSFWAVTKRVKEIKTERERGCAHYTFPAVTENITVCPEAHKYWRTTPTLLPKLERGKKKGLRSAFKRRKTFHEGSSLLVGLCDSPEDVCAGYWTGQHDFALSTKRN